MRVSPALLSLTVLASLVIGALADRALQPRTPAARPLTCRPSAPVTAAARSEEPVTLFWGNSLAFDANWELGGSFVVNCAQQGLTAAAALAQVERLPDMPVGAIVVFLGSVELARAGQVPDDFRDTVTGVVSALRAKYAASHIILAGVPFSSDPRDSWGYPEPSAANRMLASIAGSRYLDLTEALAPQTGARRTYDGVHLSRESYARLNLRITDLLRQLN